MKNDSRVKDRERWRVVVLDDVETDAIALADLLALELPGVMVRVSTRKDEVFDLLRTGDIELLVTDLLMPDASGILKPLGDRIVMELKTFYPEVEVVVVTGCDELEQAVKSLKFGASDYLVKSGTGLEQLPEVVRELLALRPSLRSPGFHCDNLIARYWSMLNSGGVGSEPGYLLECLTKLLLDSCRGVKVVATRRRNRSEEFDIVAENKGLDHLWRQFGPIVLIECKCLKGRVEREEFDIFSAKLARRGGLATLGLFVSWSGFSKGFQTVASRRQDQTVLALDRERLREWMLASDRGEYLRAQVQERLLS